MQSFIGYPLDFCFVFICLWSTLQMFKISCVVKNVCNYRYILQTVQIFPDILTYFISFDNRG